MARSDEFINGLYRYSGPYSRSSGKQTEYVYGLGEGSSGLQSALRVRLTHPEEDYTLPEDVAEADEDRSQRGWYDDSDIWHDPDTKLYSKKLFRDEDNGQGSLFKHDYTPPTIDYMAGTKDASRAGIGKALGLAAQDSQLRWGTPPEPSTNLSDHSAPVVNSLIEAGLIRGRAKDETIRPSNSYSWREGQEAAESVRDEFKTAPSQNINKVSDEEARLAQANLVAAIREGKKDPNAIPRQWRNIVQPTLPLSGFEK